jgi:hypothetical protein
MVTQTHDGNTHNPRAYSQELNPDWQYMICPRQSAVSGSIIQIG